MPTAKRLHCYARLGLRLIRVLCVHLLAVVCAILIAVSLGVFHILILVDGEMPDQTAANMLALVAKEWMDA